MLFRPNLTCKISTIIDIDVYGKEKLSEPKTVRCAIVKLVAKTEQTSVRADSSASRGMAEEMVADSRLLFPWNTQINLNDKVEIAGVTLRVLSKFPRYSISGKFDHWQVDLMVWA